MSDDSTRQQELIDALTVIAPLAERLDAAARQQREDARALLEAARRAVALVRPQREEDR